MINRAALKCFKSINGILRLSSEINFILKLLKFPNEFELWTKLEQERALKNIIMGKFELNQLA